MLPRLPTRNEIAVGSAALLVLLFASWLRRGEEIASLKTIIAAKPRVEFRDRIVEKRVVVKGDVRIVREVVKAPDGTVTSRTETVTTDKDRDVVRIETPVCPAPHRAPARYVGLIWGADGYGGSWVKGARGGINVLENWDLGGNLAREKNGATVLGGDVTFRW
jgi:hypothetical protein